jgi:hypothetical protein
LEDDFHETLTAEKLFEIVGVAPYEGLKKWEPTKYDDAFNDYVRREGGAALESACESFPAPIAIALYRSLNSARNEHERLLHFRDAAEAMILVLLAIVTGECRLRGLKLTGVTFPNGKGNQEVLTAAKFVTDSVARRLGILDGIASWAATQPALVCSGKLPIDSIRRLNDLKDIRNDFSHLQAMSEPEAELTCRDMKEQLADAVLAFSWLGEAQLTTYVEPETGNPGMARFELLRGHSQSIAIKGKGVSPATMTKCLGIIKDHLPRPFFYMDGEILEATPFLHTLLKGHRRHVLMMKKRLPDSSDILYEVAGEREEMKVPGSAALVQSDVLDQLFA